MASPLSKFVVFDHAGNRSKLYRLSLEKGFSPLPFTGIADDEDASAAEFLLGDSNWRMAFVHIVDGQWDALCNGVSDSQILVRFSTDGFSPIGPIKAKSLCLHCIKKIDALVDTDIKALKDALAVRNIKYSLLAKHIPRNIRHLIAFEEPHHLRALYILMQGILALWASDPWHEKSKEARELLQLEKLPPIPNRPFGRRSTIRQALKLQVDDDGNVPKVESDVFRRKIARELGAENLTGDIAINKMIDSIVDGLGTTNLEADAVLDGFKALQLFFKKI